MARPDAAPAKPQLDLDRDRAQAWLRAAVLYTHRANDDRIYQESCKLAGKVRALWREGEDAGAVPAAVEKARKLLTARGCGRVVERADAHCEDPAQVPDDRLVAALLGLRG